MYKKTFKNLLIITIITTAFIASSAEALTTVFYALRDRDVPHLRDHFRVMNDIKQHANKINILIPQSYAINSEGLVFEAVEPNSFKLAKESHIKIMPLVTNAGFDAKKVDTFLKSPKAQQRAIKSLTELCKQHHFYGLEIDFEHVPEKDRNAFTQFYTNAAKALHAIHCKISVAIVPRRYRIPPSAILLKRDEYWSGAYDQKALGKVSDFVVLMTYNQNGGMTTPGPNASVPLDKLAIQYALSNMPSKKIFLGIPTASNYWLMSTNQSIEHPIVGHGIGISYQQVQLLKKMYHLKWQWDNYAKVHYAMFPVRDFYHYLFVEDAASFAAKQQLAKEYKLGGIAVFRLGNEDPNIWKEIA